MIQSSNTVESIEIIKNTKDYLVAVVEVLNFKPFAMNYYKAYKEETAYYNRSVAFGVGEENDSYSINSYYKHNVEWNTITSQHEVIKNWISPKKEILFKGTLKECFQFIEDIVVQYS